MLELDAASNTGIDNMRDILDNARYAPTAGRYKLTYRIKPPSAGGLGRHADRATGVDPWWEPFEVSFDWDYPGPPAPQN